MLNPENKPVVVITGCSSGIGEALVAAFAQAGCSVFATARDPSAIKSSTAALATQTLTLDVTNRDSILRAVGRVVEMAGRIDIVVNNAGLLITGPVVELDLDVIRRQFETNVIGAIAVCQAVFPFMARRGGGRIVNVGSPSAILVTPFGGVYGGSKAALHAISEALRLEVAPFGIDVILVIPGAVRTSIARNALASTRSQDAASFYREMAEGIRRRAEMTQQKPTEADAFARQVVAKIMRPHPPQIVRAGRGSSLFPRLRQFVPNRLLALMHRRYFRLPARLDPNRSSHEE